MDADTILRLLQNAGYRGLGTDGASVFMEDPTCILRSFETFMEYAWIGIVFVTAILLFGWAMAMIRGSNNSAISSIANNLGALVLIFGILGIAGPIVNMIWGDDLFARGCRTITVSIDEINRILDTRNARMSDRDKYSLYEDLMIFDSGVSDAPTDTEVQSVAIDVSVAANDATPVSAAADASESGKDVVYTYPDGTRYKRTGGSRAWRNNNPGNLRYSEFSRRAGAIARAGGFAVFPDEETGMAAIGKLMRTRQYSGLTIAQAIARYAPPFENNTAGYNKRIQELTGLDITMRVADLSDAQIAKMADAIRHIEGWTPGTITKDNAS